MLLAALSTGYKVGLGLVGLAFIVFALVSAFVIPAFRPDYQMEELPHNPWIHQPFEDYDGIRPHQLAAWIKKGETAA